MAELNPIGFLLNQSGDAKQAQVVDAPAFSLTKVLASAAIIVTPIATILVDQLSKLNLTAQQYVVLAVGLLGFLAVTASADVLGRSLATGAEKNGQAARAAAGEVVPFRKAIDGRRIDGREDPAVKIVASAFAGGKPQFLVREGDALNWVDADDVTIP